MKTIKYLSLALAAMLLTACQGDWDDPDTTNAFGNSSITEKNVITIQQLKDMYPSEAASIVFTILFIALSPCLDGLDECPFSS